VLVAARLVRITRRAHTLSQTLEEGVAICAANMPSADELMLRNYAAMAEKECELISDWTRAALAAAKARGTVLRSSEAEPSFDALEHSNARNGPPQAAFTLCETYAASAT
jgi:DNA invertase Pin-like site-specific DNA recombinase